MASAGSSPRSERPLHRFPEGWAQRLGDMSIEERLPAMRALMLEYLEKNGGHIPGDQMLVITQSLAEEHGAAFRQLVRDWRAERGIAA